MEKIDAGFKIEYAKDLKWVNHEKTLMECVVKFEHIPEEIPFGIVPDDMYKHSLDLWENALAGKYGEIAECPPKNEFQILMDEYKNKFDGDFSLDKI